jgi:endonuclease G
VRIESYCQQLASPLSNRPRWPARVATALLLMSALQAFAGTSRCAQHYVGQRAPDIINRKLAVDVRELCFSAFGVLHSGVTRTPLWSAEHLTREAVESAAGLPRVDGFHAEEQLPRGARAELTDYARSGYDRGHMSPNKDMPTVEAQRESFSLSNMVPQNPNNNRILWEGIESAVRGLAKRDGDVYVITGPLFQGANLDVLRGHVYVPTQLFKLVYDPRRQAAAAYLTPNAPGMAYQVISVAQLSAMAGIDFLPAVSARIKETAMPLPAPHPHGESRGESRRTARRSDPNALDTLRGWLR